MSKNQIAIQKALNPAYKKFKPSRKEIDNFVDKLEQCMENIEIVDRKNESEEHLKSPIKRFLEQTFYSKHEINTKEHIDLAIYLGKDATFNAGVIIEAKRISNRSEFPTPSNLNKKAFQELLHYYLRERIDLKNNNIKHLVITNGHEWFFFKGEDFYEFFYKNRSLVQEYKRFRDGLKDTTKNELFYKEIASEYIDTVKYQIPFVYVDLRDTPISHMKERDLINIYKLFSDVHLLGKSFGNDSNQLNKEFYNELLHIIGLEEVKENSKRVIQRKKDSNRDYGSLIENTIFTLEDREYLSRVKHLPNEENKSFTVGLELCLTWVNRILFLKLLESQLLTYNDNHSSYRFLNNDFINGFDELNDLFFSALAKPIANRHPRYAEKFKHIPYLNSSLFEHSRLESITFDITALKDEPMEVYGSTILKDNNNRKYKGKLNTLEYIFRFLEAYDFSTEAGSEIEDKHETKSLINASVLGLIFEKINGYKDGSFYTPGMITMFMCRETLRKIVVQKFKESENDEIEDFDDVRSYCSRYFKTDDVKRFNNLINSIKVCDPSVGSGHFLVSALNEMIAIKSELGILTDEAGRQLQCEVAIENDELYVSDAHGELFTYQRKDPKSLRIQKSIFHEKQNIIENSLFGVDINPNSVNICRLRLWIELLKNAYYTNKGELQTLPNIDINIKKGNSLVHRFSLEDSLKSAFKNKEVNYSIEEYKQAVNDYKQTNSKSKKRDIQEIIDTIKNNFKSTLDKKIIEKVQKAQGEFEQEDLRQQNLQLFGEKLTKADKDSLKKLKSRAVKAQKEKEEILNNVKFRNAFEWRFEFPEVLDDEGNYIGFDALIGNPPYIQLQKMGTESDVLEKMDYETYAKTGDIYSLFYELGFHILRRNGLLTFITSNKWMRAAYGESLRNFLATKTDPKILIDFAGTQIFDTATVDTNILMFAKDKNRQQTQACIIKEKVLNNLSVFFRQHHTNAEFINSGSWIILSPIERSIKEKIERIGTPLKEWNIQINYGIKTGFNDAFIINSAKRKELIEQDPKSDEIIRPILRGRDIKRFGYEFADLYVILAYNGSYKILHTKYPAVYQHLKKYELQLKNRGQCRYTSNGKPNVDPNADFIGQHHWLELDNNPTLQKLEDFYRQKIIWGEISDRTKFAIDLDGCYFNEATTFLMVGESLLFLVAYLNSKISEYLFSKIGTTTGVGTVRWKKFTIEQLIVPKISTQNLLEYERLSIEMINSINNGDSYRVFSRQINQLIYEEFKFSIEEIAFIEAQ